MGLSHKRKLLLIGYDSVIRVFHLNSELEPDLSIPPQDLNLFNEDVPNIYIYIYIVYYKPNNGKRMW